MHVNQTIGIKIELEFMSESTVDKSSPKSVTWESEVDGGVGKKWKSGVHPGAGKHAFDSARVFDSSSESAVIGIVWGTWVGSFVWTRGMNYVAQFTWDVVHAEPCL